MYQLFTRSLVDGVKTFSRASLILYLLSLACFYGRYFLEKYVFSCFRRKKAKTKKISKSLILLRFDTKDVKTNTFFLSPMKKYLAKDAIVYEYKLSEECFIEVFNVEDTALANKAKAVGIINGLQEKVVST